MNKTNDLIGVTKKFIALILISTLIITILNNENIVKAENNDLKNLNIIYQRKNNKDKNENNNILSKGSKLVENIVATISYKNKAYEVSFEDNIIGYISSDYTEKDLLDLLTKKYISEKKINSKSVVFASVDYDINLDTKLVDDSQIQDINDIANKIYNQYKNNSNSLDFEFICKEESNIEIMPTTKIIQSDELFVGDTKVVEGEKGQKKQVKEITYKNNTSTKFRLISEKIVKEPKNKEVYKGNKNPYAFGVAFLNAPTRGGVTTSAYGERWNSFHKGIDIAGNTGENVFAAIDGEVIYAQYNNGGYGNLITIKHDNDMTTYYAHLSEIKVSKGDKVKKGDIIGFIGNTGFSTGPHLHFELRVNDKPVDPTKYIIK